MLLRNNLRSLRYFSTSSIYALCTGEGRSGVAIVRVSGSQAGETWKRLQNKTTTLPPPRTAKNCTLMDPVKNEVLDQALALWFPNPYSYTGEDVMEYHVHGSRAVVQGVLDALSTVEGCRPAEAGEFTERAFENQKMDLMQVEGLADLLAAETEAQRRQALRQLSGSVAKVYEAWRSELLGALAHTEAVIDFGDDEMDVTDEAYQRVVENVKRLVTSMETSLRDNRRGEIVRDGLQVAILGAPNAGKSSFLNLVAKRPAAIVSSRAGTTRDVVQVPMNIGGYPVILSDTAGLRDTHDDIELQGIERTHQAMEDSDIQVLVLDGQTLPLIEPRVEQLLRPGTIVLLNKTDLLSPVTLTAARDVLSSYPDINIIETSCTSGHGLDAFLDLLTSRHRSLLQNARSTSSSDALITRARHRHHLTLCVHHLHAFLSTFDQIDVGCEELRLAVHSLGRILGRVDPEEILDILFHDFCIGK